MGNIYEYIVVPEGKTMIKERQATIPLWPLQEPDDVDCSDDRVPALLGQRKAVIAKLLSMTKVLFRDYRLDLYSFLNRCLRDGRLNELVGTRVLDRVISAEICDFKHVDYWRIDRENYYADVLVELTLQTPLGSQTWTGYLVCWCEFFYPLSHYSEMAGERNKGRLDIEIQELTETPDREGFDRLSKYLIPYSTNQRVDEIAEQIWQQYCPEALYDPDRRSAKLLADRLGLKVVYYPVYEHSDLVDSILFFKEGELIIGEDRVENGHHIKADQGRSITIPANTIVVNTNRIRFEYSAFNIFHECYHFLQHYLFICLQDLDSNDRRKMPTETVFVDAKTELKDPIHFAENQANRGGLALMMPATHTRYLIWEECRRVRNYRHSGELYELAIISMNQILDIPYFRIRQRMIQLGFVEARGAMNYVDKKRIAPFSFHRDSWRKPEHTFIIAEKDVKRLQKKDDRFQRLMKTGEYIYADGHVVMNRPELVQWDKYKGRLMLTDWAVQHVDQCCRRFVRHYIQKDIGEYFYGRMNHDTEYIVQNEFFLGDIMKEQGIDELDAREVFIDRFPKNFKEAIRILKKKRKVSDAKLAEMMNLDDSKFGRILDDPRRYRNEDFLTMMCLYLQLPDWLSRLVFIRARFQLDDEDKRHRAIKYILRCMSNDGIEEANEFLEKRGLEKLSFVG